MFEGAVERDADAKDRRARSQCLCAAMTSIAPWLPCALQQPTRRSRARKRRRGDGDERAAGRLSFLKRQGSALSGSLRGFSSRRRGLNARGFTVDAYEREPVRQFNEHKHRDLNAADGPSRSNP